MEAPTAREPLAPGTAWSIALSLGALAAVASWLANQVILGSFADAPRPADLLFELLPYVPAARWLTVVALAAGLGVFLWGVLRQSPSRLPAVGTRVALMYLLRAAMIVLTPLAPAHGEGVFVFAPAQLGMFPSGHTALLALLAMLAPGDRVWVRRFLWLTVAVMIVGLLLAHGHYSIDIAGGLLLAYFVASVKGRGRMFARSSGSSPPEPAARLQ